jgi:hypothetical protein
LLFTKIINKFHCAHQSLINLKYFRIYHKGSYAKWAIEFGHIGHGEFVILFKTKKRFCETVFYHSIKKVGRMVFKLEEEEK